MSNLIRPGLRALVVVRFKEFFREPEALFWVYIFPLLMATGLGIAFRNQPPKQVPVGWAGWTESSETLRAALAADSGLILVPLPDSAAAALALRIGRVDLLLLPAGDSVEYRYDDTRPEAAAARLRVDDAVQRARGRTDPVTTRDQIVRERGSRYIDFLLPGLLAMNLMGSGIWGSGFAIVNARKNKLLKRLVATPMAKPDYLSSFLIAQLSMLVFEVGILLTFGMVVFDVPVRGAWWLLGLAVVLGSLMFGGLGLLVASRPRTLEGASGLMNLIMLPMWVLSGVFFSSARFPDTIQPLIKALPLTALVNALRAIMLEGATLGGVRTELLIMLLWLGLGYLLALKLFRWQ